MDILRSTQYVRCLADFLQIFNSRLSTCGAHFFVLKAFSPILHNAQKEVSFRCKFRFSVNLVRSFSFS